MSIAARSVRMIATWLAVLLPVGCVTGFPAQWQPPRRLEDGVPVDTAPAPRQRAHWEQLQRALNQGAYPGLHSVLVARDGRLLFESHAAGYDSHRLHPQYSAAKSAVSLLYGMALERTAVPPPDALVLPGVAVAGPFRNVDERKRAMRFRDLLSMTTGLDCGVFDSPGNPCGQVLLRARNPLQQLFDLPMVATPGERFGYTDAAPFVIATLVAAYAHQDWNALARQWLLRPLGIDHDLDAGLGPREMFRLGQLVLQQGRWHGKELVPAAWIAQSTAVQYRFARDAAPPFIGYGYFWWIAEHRRGGRSWRSFSAQGNGGQMILVVPDLQLVVVTTGGNVDRPERRDLPMRLFEEQVLPLLTDEKATPVARTARAA